MRLEVIHSPLEFASLRERDLSGTTCVVFDVLRATSTMATAFHHGVLGIRPLASIEEALAMRRRDPTVLLAGERGGRRIGGELTGGQSFDLGNSPREFTRQRVGGRQLAMTTTNGTRALRACAHATHVLAASFLNLEAVRREILARGDGPVVLVCSGTGDAISLEDTIAAGACCDKLGPEADLADSAWVALQTWRGARGDLVGSVLHAANARNLLGIPELKADVDFCLRFDRIDVVPRLNVAGVLTVEGPRGVSRELDPALDSS